MLNASRNHVMRTTLLCEDRKQTIEHVKNTSETRCNPHCRATSKLVCPLKA